MHYFIVNVGVHVQIQLDCESEAKQPNLTCHVFIFVCM